MSLADHFCADETAHVFAYRVDALSFLRTLPDSYVHTIITDPPYGLGDAKPDVVAAAITAWATGDRERVPDGRGFMGRRWDAFVPPPAVWDECLRVLKPGGHLAVFAGSRTVDLMGLSIRLAGFDMRDGISAWLYGSGFPKSLDVGKAIDARGARDADSVALLKSELRRMFDASDMTLGELNERCGFEASGYLRTSSTWATLFPSPEKWRRMREVVGGDEQVGEKFRAAEREVVGRWSTPGRGSRSADQVYGLTADAGDITAPATDAARAWSGWGTALKPAHEPILIARKPLDGTVAANTLAHGCGGLNVDACRVIYQDDNDRANARPQGAATSRSGALAGKAQAESCPSTSSPTTAPTMGSSTISTTTDSVGAAPSGRATFQPTEASGRWPTNVVLAHAPLADPVTGEVVGDACADGCVPECHVRQLDEQSAGTRAAKPSKSGGRSTHALGMMNDDAWQAREVATPTHDGEGASRFYPTFRYTAKAGKRERPQAWGAHLDCACEPSRPLDPETGALPPWHRRGTVCATCERPATYRGHSTVKPLGLMSWLVALLTPTEAQLGEGQTGLVLDPFSGSGTTLEAARSVGVKAIGIEQDSHSCRLIARRLGVPEPARDPAAGPLFPPRERPSPVELALVPDPDPFAALLEAVITAPTAAALARIIVEAPADLWAPEHQAVAALRADQLVGPAVAA